MPSDKLDARRAEFKANRWDHTNDAFQTQFDKPERLSPADLLALSEILKALKKGARDAELSKIVRALVANERDDIMATLLQLVGSTRNKIITDLKAMTAGTKLKVPGSYSSVHRDDAVWAHAGPYLVGRLRSVLGPLVDDSVEGAFEALNNATYPGWIRQERAKRQGHEAERRLASLLAACEVPFEPREKAENPMCPDVQILDVSFDIVVPNAKSARVCVKATVHTSNIGQYGESKDHLEVDEARAKLSSAFGRTRPTLLVLIDGVGFDSNRAGLDGVLEKSDEFCQFKTIWKGVIVCAARMDMNLRVELPGEVKQTHKEFLTRWNYLKNVVEPGTLDADAVVEAGEARIETPA